MVNGGQHRRYLPPEVASGLRFAFERRGLTLRDVAREVGISESYLYRLTVGERCPSRSVSWRLIDALNLDDDLACDLLDAAVIKPNSRSA